MSTALHKRYMALYFPHLAIDRLAREAAEPLNHPLALTRRAQNRIMLVAVNDAAEVQGLQPGMALATARAICARLDVREHQAQADAALLDRLANWAGRYSPSLGLDGTDGLVLDITGGAHLFGGENPMLMDALRSLTNMGFSVHGAITDTPGAAWALARFGGGREIALAGNPADALAPLPTTALRMDAATVEGLNAMGLKTLADLFTLPRASLANRYGLELARRLDKVLGATPDPIRPRPHAKPYRHRLQFPEPIGTATSIEGAIDVLLERLCQQMEAAQTGCRRLHLTCQRTDNTPQHVEIGTASPNRTPAHLAYLFLEKIATIDPGHGIDAMELSAPAVEPFRPEQDAIGLSFKQTEPGQGEADGPTNRPAGSLAALIDKLENRLGAGSVGRLEPVASHLPERAQRWRPAAAIRGNTAPPHWPRTPLRPLQILTTPEPLFSFGHDAKTRLPTEIHAQGERQRIEQISGPERISANWWRHSIAWRGGARDYYRVQVESGQQFWIFHESKTRRPRWYLHGLFG